LEGDRLFFFFFFSFFFFFFFLFLLFFINLSFFYYMCKETMGETFFPRLPILFLGYFSDIAGFLS